MFEKWRIKEHMEVVDSMGRHVGIVDDVDDGRVKLTRSDSADGKHHWFDIDAVDRIADNRVHLQQGAVVTAMQEPAMAGAGNSGANIGGSAADPGLPGTEDRIMGTSGHGTGMGGSGTGN